MRKNRTLVYFFFSFLLFLAIFPAAASAQDDECECSCWTEYRCIGQCYNGRMEHQSRVCCAGCCSGCSPWTTIETCAEWEMCYAGSGCRCEGSCIRPPGTTVNASQDSSMLPNPRYYDNPTYTDQPTQNKDSNNIYLPVKLDWNDVWGWRDNPECQGQYDCVKSYRININDTTANSTQILNRTLPASEYNYREGFTDRQCKIDIDFKTTGIPFFGPALLSPAAEAVIVPEDSIVFDPLNSFPPSFYFNWTQLLDVPATWYIIEIADNPGFYPKNIVVRDKSDWLGNVFDFVSINPSCLRPYTYYWWRVAGCNSVPGFINACGNWSEPRMFKTSFYESPCFLKSHNQYNWQVQACCAYDGSNCSSLSSWDFATNPAPEPVSPSDPDWNGEDAIVRDAPWPLQLDGAGFKAEWCKINDCLLYGTSTIFDKDPNTAVDDITYCAPESYNFYLRYLNEPNNTNTSRYQCHPELGTTGECIPITITDERAEGQNIPHNAFFNERYRLLTKISSYAWRVEACRGWGADCNGLTSASQENTNPAGTIGNWLFSIQDFPLSAPILQFPADDPMGQNPVGLPVMLSWEGDLGTMSYRYTIDGVTSGVTTKPNITLSNPPLEFNRIYTWHVTPCWDYAGTRCQNISTTWHFKTGMVVSCVNPPNGARDVLIPVELEWSTNPQAKSYYVEAILQGDGGIIPEGVVYTNSIYLNYPAVQPGNTYLWHVLACADESGVDCGERPPDCVFTTCQLGRVDPSTFSPSTGQVVYSYQMPLTISWQSVPCAPFYKYSIYYTEKDAAETGDCLASDASPVAERVIPAPASPGTMSDFVSFTCLGKYVWRMQTCLDEACSQTGPTTESYFLLQQGDEGGGEPGGLVPCGQRADNPGTSWNERDKCEIKHLFLFVKILIDFLLWRIGVILLVILVVITGVLYYIAMGNTTVLDQIKMLWRAAGIGYGLVFFAWMIINFFLLLFGYSFAIFGPWYNINF